MEADAGSAAPNNKAIATYLRIYSSIRLVGIYWEKLVLWIIINEFNTKVNVDKTISRKELESHGKKSGIFHNLRRRLYRREPRARNFRGTLKRRAGRNVKRGNRRRLPESGRRRKSLRANFAGRRHPAAIWRRKGRMAAQRKFFWRRKNPKKRGSRNYPRKARRIFKKTVARKCGCSYKRLPRR